VKTIWALPLIPLTGAPSISSVVTHVTDDRRAAIASPDQASGIAGLAR
jgi:hypothetical protein